jgi:hypothetical protein
MPIERTLNGRRIRGLTLWRPWPWAFTHAGKRVENRPWKPPSTILGGYVALHAGLKFDHGACVGMQEGLFGPAAATINPRDTAHPQSVIVAVAKVEGFKEHVGDPEGWAFGPFVWKMPNLMILPAHIPCKGAQGLWRLPDGVFNAVADQMEGTD